MSAFDLSAYLPNLPEGPFFETLLAGPPKPHEILKQLHPALMAQFAGLRPQGSLPAERRTDQPEPGLQLNATVCLEQDFFDADLNIFIGQGTLVEAGATLKGPTFIEGGSQVRQGAYVRGGFFAARGSVIGHTTEVKNAVFCNHVEAGHFTYVGDSFIGPNSNLGAGTKISNLEFRTTEQKKGEQFPEMFLRLEGKNHPSGLQKFGALLGEGSETGCNSVISPMVFLGRDSWVLPNLCVPKGFYKPGSRLFNLADCKASRW